MYGSAELIVGVERERCDIGWDIYPHSARTCDRHTHSHVCSHTHMYICTHTHIHTRTHIYKRTHPQYCSVTTANPNDSILLGLHPCEESTAPLQCLCTYIYMLRYGNSPTMCTRQPPRVQRIPARGAGGAKSASTMPYEALCPHMRLYVLIWHLCPHMASSRVLGT